jgi:hypothetical protein
MVGARALERFSLSFVSCSPLVLHPGVISPVVEQHIFPDSLGVAIVSGALLTARFNLQLHQLSSLNICRANPV